jgi:hypothetical protein
MFDGLQGPGTLWAACLVLGVAVALALAVTGPARRRRMAAADGAP